MPAYNQLILNGEEHKKHKRKNLVTTRICAFLSIIVKLLYKQTPACRQAEESLPRK
jgi:hypothetical protein